MDAFPLPLPSRRPPLGFEFSDRALSQISTQTAFDTGVKDRDTFNGRQRCVVCGRKEILEICHIIPQSDREIATWETLKHNNYVPKKAKSAKHEPRNGIVMCNLHHSYFDQHYFYIRYIPNTRQFLLVNHSSSEEFAGSHGKAILLNIDHRRAPFPATFLIHEQRVRGYWPFSQPSPIPPSNRFPHQDWIASDAQDTSGGENTASDVGPSCAAMKNKNSGESDRTASGQLPNTMTLTLDDDTISKILFATWNSLSWKTCVQVGTSWEGTAEENIAKYKENFTI